MNTREWVRVSEAAILQKRKREFSWTKKEMLSLRVELKTSRLLNGCSNQLSYESLVFQVFVDT